MERIRSIEVGAHVGERVRVAGWLHAVRRLGGVSFVVVEHLTSEPTERAAVPSTPTEAVTRVARPVDEARDTKASPVALPPATDIESPGAAARAASLPATIASASLRHAAANGDPAAEFEIGARFADGRGVSPDLQQAFAWYQRAAMRGFPSFPIRRNRATSAATSRWAAWPRERPSRST